MFGTTQLYVFVDHTKFKSGSLPEYEDAMEEIALSAGFDEDDDDAEKSPGDLPSESLSPWNYPSSISFFIIELVPFTLS